jgi:hypothetical protein
MSEQPETIAIAPDMQPETIDIVSDMQPETIAIAPDMQPETIAISIAVNETKTGTLMVSNNVIDKILSEIKPLHIERVDENIIKSRIFIIEQSLSSNFSNSFINSFNKYVSKTEDFACVVQVAVNSINTLIKGDRQLTINDIANFVTLIHSIYAEIDRINLNIKISIKSVDLVNMCYILLQIILSLIIVDDNDYQSILVVLSSAIKMLTFTMLETSTSTYTSTLSCSIFKCFKCFKCGNK